MKNEKHAESLKWYEKASGKHFSKKTEAGNTTSVQKKISPAKEFSPVETHHQQHNGPRSSITLISSLFNATALPKDAVQALNSFDKIISSSHPISSKQRALLPQQIRELSHELTDERYDRRLGYMNTTTTLSAYVYYYMWWNLVRLTKLFANLPAESFKLDDKSICLDIGSGPLTVPVALFLSHPELRTKKLTWYCLDISSSALAAGEDIFLSTAAYLQCEPWKIIRVKGEMGTPIKEKASFITCANVFNEIVEDIEMPPDYLAKKYGEKILSYAIEQKKETVSPPAQVLVIEPGIPKSARFISLLRDALLRKEFIPQAPCTHCGTCPMDGKKGGKWCNFAFSTDDAPLALRKLSEASQLPKERAVLSFILATRAAKNVNSSDFTFRVASDPIRLPGERTGYYACSEKGLLLIVTQKKLFSGQSFKMKTPNRMTHIDAKSGAFVIDAE